MERIYSSKRFTPALILALALGVLAAYSNTFHASFQFDDIPVIEENAQIQSLANIPELLRGLRGLTMATFALNYAAGGLDVTGYHIVNTAIHIVNSILAYFLVLNIFLSLDEEKARSRRLAAFSALIFALHPVQTQAVTYIVQRMESLSSLFYLAALLFFIGSAKAKSRAKRLFFYLIVALSYLSGFYSKESAFTLPAALFLYDFHFIAKGSLRGVLSKWPLYALLAALLLFFSITTIAPLGGFGDISKEPVSAVEPQSPKGTASAGFGVKEISPREYLLTQMTVLTYYMALLAVPVNQNLDYDFPVSRGLFQTPVTNPGTVLAMPVLPPAASLAAIAAIIGLGFYFLARTQNAPSGKRAVSFFIFWFFLILAPTSSFIPILDVIYEHRVYLASLGFFVIFVLAVDSLCGLISGRRARPFGRIK